MAKDLSKELNVTFLVMYNKNASLGLIKSPQSQLAPTTTKKKSAIFKLITVENDAHHAHLLVNLFTLIYRQPRNPQYN